MSFNKRNWSVMKCIQDRVDRESLAEWAKSSERPFTPRLEPYTKPQRHIGWLIFFKSFVYQFKP